MEERQLGQRPTQVEIAKLAGVSQATVSLVVNGAASAGQVSAEKRARVLEVIDEVGYHVNLAARNLRGKSNQILGLYTFEPVFPVDQRDFYYPFLLGVEEEAATTGFDLLLYSSAGNGGTRSIYAGGLNRLRKSDGCVLLGRQLAREDLVRLARENFPFVFIGRREIPDGDVPYVTADYAAATRAMVQRLTALGHTNILFLKHAHGAEAGADREAGYHEGLAAAGLESSAANVYVADPESPVTAALLSGWLDSGVTAILVEPTEQNTTGKALAAAADQAGVEIPQDCSVAYLGDAPESTPDRTWSSFTLPRAEMGRRAVRMLIRLLDDSTSAFRHESLPCRPIDGDTVAAPAPRGNPAAQGRA